MKKLKLYIETSVWNFLLADDTPDLQDFTLKFFKEIKAGEYDIYISDLVITEINRTKDEIKRDRLLDVLNQYHPIILPFNDEAVLFTENLMKNEVVPLKYRDDAVHISYAVVNELDVLVSWNLTHIVKLKTKVKVNALAALDGYKGILISTPEEVIGYAEGT